MLCEVGVTMLCVVSQVICSQVNERDNDFAVQMEVEISVAGTAKAVRNLNRKGFMVLGGK